jgi:hypothetical protein
MELTKSSKSGHCSSLKNMSWKKGLGWRSEGSDSSRGGMDRGYERGGMDRVGDRDRGGSDRMDRDRDRDRAGGSFSRRDDGGYSNKLGPDAGSFQRMPPPTDRLGGGGDPMGGGHRSGGPMPFNSQGPGQRGGIMPFPPGGGPPGGPSQFAGGPPPPVPGGYGAGIVMVYRPLQPPAIPCANAIPSQASPCFLSAARLERLSASSACYHWRAHHMPQEKPVIFASF